MSTKSAHCQYGSCTEAFTSKHSMKEHVLSHLVADPPKPVHQHARVAYQPGGGWTVIESSVASKGGLLNDKDESESRMDVDQGELPESSQMAIARGDQVDDFHIKDIVPSASQAGNITTTTTTTTTSGGTTSQPITFSPVLPERPSFMTQSTQPSEQSKSQPSQRISISSPSDPVKAAKPQSGQGGSSPFVHSAPSRTTPSMVKHSDEHEHRDSASQSPSRTTRRVSPFISDSQLISSTPLDQRPGSSPPTTTSSKAQSSQPPIESADPSTPATSTRKSLSFGDALAPSRRPAPNPQTAVSFGFGTR